MTHEDTVRAIGLRARKAQTEADALALLMERIEGPRSAELRTAVQQIHDGLAGLRAWGRIEQRMARQRRGC